MKLYTLNDIKNEYEMGECNIGFEEYLLGNYQPLYSESLEFKGYVQIVESGVSYTRGYRGVF